MEKVNKVKEIKLKECPCCGGETKFESRMNFTTKEVRAKCSECNLSTEWVEESVDYCAKEEAAKAWNMRVNFGKTCPECGYSDTETKSVYSDGTLVEISTRCLKCGTFIED
jgi:hypothetical protein